MNWNAVAFDWNHARAFLATAEEGSLSAAAKALRTTQPTLGRQVAALEADLSVTLFERIGKKLVLTPAGRELLSHVKAMRDAAEHISLSATGQTTTLEGEVMISASDIYSAHILPPILQSLRKIAPKLDLTIVATNTISDLQRREADIAIRHVRPKEPDLVARLVATNTARFYAAHAYLQDRPKPKQITDLAPLDFVGFGDIAELRTYYSALGLDIGPDQFSVNCANALVAWEFVRKGMGLAIMSTDVANQHSDVTPLLTKMPPFLFPVWLTTHRELHTSGRIRMVFDLLAAHFAAQPAPPKDGISFDDLL